MNHLQQFITQNLLTQKNLIIKILSSVSTKGNKSVDPFDYLNQYSCKVKMALIIESIFISKTVVSLHIKVHEVYVKPLKPRRAIKESIVILSQVNIIHIRFFIVLFHLLPALDFSSFFSVTWLDTFTLKNSLKWLLINSEPLSDQIILGFRLLVLNISPKALLTLSVFLSFRALIQPYLLKTSITVSKYFTRYHSIY